MSSTEATEPDPYDSALQILRDIRQRVQFLHPALAHDVPVAIAEGTVCRVYQANGAYHFAQETLLPMPVPKGVRAAFPLDALGGPCAAVVTGEVFDEPGGYATLLHEAVHCYQAETCEEKLKARLSIAQQARAAGDMMWEIQYPFPYGDPGFERAYTALLQALASAAPVGGRQACQAGLRALDANSIEYMVWQEWKEGLARLIETWIQRELGLPENHGGGTLPLSRVAFYEGGARIIAYLEAQRPGISRDLEALYELMSSGSF